MSDFNTRIIEEFRANGGTVSTAGFGSDLVILHSVGAKSGAVRESPVLALRQPDGSWFIAASKAGAPDNPAWYHNLVHTPEASLEVPGDTGVERVDVVAEVLAGAERDAAWAQFTERSEGFRQYEERAAGRVIPVVRLTRR
ncbi:nitroreductase/quinone reductase family protein [Cnuibacter sp. UC19_7]|uniref:nitroreductase/quinone reductase family protein n=1 Tax=Cnuibacter sp. UC19_7 TaxID=3350166 RepID=UPI00366FA89A